MISISGLSAVQHLCKPFDININGREVRLVTQNTTTEAPMNNILIALCNEVQVNLACVEKFLFRCMKELEDQKVASILSFLAYSRQSNNYYSNCARGRAYARAHPCNETHN